MGGVVGTTRGLASGALLAACLVACDGGEKGPPHATGDTADTDTDTDTPTPDDGDGDGVPAALDCDDTDPTVRPGIDERCDGLDTDCDPLTDDPVGVVGRSDGGNHDTIGEAVAAAGAGATIWVCAGTYPEAVTVDHDLTFVGLGAVTVDAGGLGPVFEIANATVSLTDLTLVNGIGSANGPAPTNGGGVNAYGSTRPVTLTRVVVEDSLAELAGGVLFGPEGGELIDCALRDNVAGTHGGGVYSEGDVTISGTTFEGNTAAGYGGALAVGESAAASVTDSVLEGNHASNGGGVFSFPRGLVELTGSTIRDNVASNGGGGLYVWDSDFTGGEVTGNDGTGQGGGVFVYEGGSLTATTILDNQAVDGGGLWVQGQVDLSGVLVDGNVASDSGGGAYFLDADVTATGTTFSHNTATVRAGGLQLVDSAMTDGTIAENNAVDGGGVYVSGAGSGTSQLTGTAISDNAATASGGGIFGGADYALTDVDLTRNVSAERGGGLYAAFSANGTIEGGTIFGNAAVERGGGVYPNGGSTMLMTGTEITANTALRGAGFYVNEDSTLTLVDAIVERNGDLTTVSGGGARVTVGTLYSTNTSWGDGPTDNVPDDVYAEFDGPAVGYGSAETFQCDENGCTPPP